jgi:glycosyltransferase involved in cell wall biosynthesis
LKIAFIDVTTTVFVGGIQTAVWQLAFALTDLGHEVTIYGGEGTNRADLAGRSVVVKTYSFTPRERFPNFGTRFRKLAERLSFARQARNDVAATGHDWVVLTKPFDFFWPYLMPAGHRTRFMFMSGGTDFVRGDRWLAKNLDAFVACSHFNAQQNYGRFRRPVGVIFNGVDIDRFRPGQRDNGWRRRLGFSDNDIVFVFAGRVIGLKGLEIAVRALPKLSAFPVKLFVVGNGSAVPRVQRCAIEVGVAERVVFHQAVGHDELPALYACADAGIFPALGEEAFGISVAEAMACGLPVVASYNGGMPEVVGNEGTCGELFALGDIDACAAAMRRLSNSAALRRTLGDAARARIVSMFTWEHSARRLLGAMGVRDNGATAARDG